MNTNPFTEEISALQRAQDKAHAELQEWKTKLAWFQAFDYEKAADTVRSTQRTVDQARARLTQAQQAETRLKAQAASLQRDASLGIDPRHWFSAERALAKQQLVSLYRDLTGLHVTIASAKSEISAAEALSLACQHDLATVRAFDPLLAQSAIAALGVDLEQRQPSLAHLLQRSKDLDDVLRQPLRDLKEQDSKLAQLMQRIKRAEFYDKALTNAANSYERSRIHTTCESELGDPRPGNVLRRSRSAQPGVQASIDKLKTRIEKLVMIARLDIRHIVIDGNNLCYGPKGRLKPVLSALDALVPHLAQKYKITLIFDAGIKGMLKTSAGDKLAFLQRCFPEVETIYIVQSKNDADQTILGLAEIDRHTFVLSNDAYDEYRDRAAVREDRKLNHDVVPPMAFVHDLQVAVQLRGELDSEAF